MNIPNAGKIIINVQTEPQIEYYINYTDFNTIIIRNPNCDNGKEEVIYI